MLPHPLEPQDLQLALGAHPPDLAVPSLVDDHAQLCPVSLPAQFTHLRGADGQTHHVPDAAQPFCRVFHRPGHRHPVLLGHLMAGVQQPVGQGSVIGQQKQPL